MIKGISIWIFLRYLFLHFLNWKYVVLATLCLWTWQSLRKRMNLHRADNNDSGFRVLYKHLKQPDHDPSLFWKEYTMWTCSMKFITTPCSPFRKDRKTMCIRELDIVMPYGCNDNTQGLWNVSSSACSNVNVMSLFNSNLNRRVQ